MRPTNISKQRIMGEVKNLAKQKLSYLHAAPLPDDLYTWHFTIQGPQNTQFHEGIYHGTILLPFEYPFKPPDIVFMNKNGRFQTNTKICLTITQYHPEEWNSAWTIRTMLQAVVSLFAENVQGVGALSSSHEIRAFLAKNSHSFVCEKCGLIKSILEPRHPKTENEHINQVDKNIQIQEPLPSVDRKMSESQVKVIPPQITKRYSEDRRDISNWQSFKDKKQATVNISNRTNWQQPLSHPPISQKHQQSKGNYPEIIYVKDRNYEVESLLGLTTFARHLQKKSLQLDRVYQSIRWVD